jgi:hypothetical protein
MSVAFAWWLPLPVSHGWHARLTPQGTPVIREVLGYLGRHRPVRLVQQYVGRHRCDDTDYVGRHRKGEFT